MTQEDQEDAEYEFDLYFHSLHEDHFSEEGRKLFGKHLATRNRQWLYDGEVWVHLTNEEQKVRTESYREFYCAIVGREVPEYKPQPLQLCSLLTLRRKYKRSLAYLWNKLFHKDRLIICSNEKLPEVINVYNEFLKILDDDDHQAWERSYRRWKQEGRAIEEKRAGVLEARKKRIDEAEALREGKLKIAWSVIATPESLRRYLYGVNDGVAYEHAMCRIFQDLGFRCRQTKTSGDQGVDLILILNGRKIAIQCKFYSQPVGNAAVQEVYAGMSYYRCDEAWVLTNSSYTAGANKLAGRTGVRLLHHDELKNVLPNT